MAESVSFKLLHTAVQRWIYDQGWEGLRSIQEQAIPLILKADKDVIISASTAAGKTEAAFFPIVTNLASIDKQGIRALCISPLKALINDQYRRLEPLCNKANLLLTPWHGDVSKSLKDKIHKKPSGILLITPESLEALLINKGNWCLNAFGNLDYIIIDEFHAFIGTERGIQLISQLHRIETMINRKVPRIALSATLGDLSKIPSVLRPNEDFPFITPNIEHGKPSLLLKLHGYIQPADPISLDDEKLNKESQKNYARDAIVNDLFTHLRKSSNLVFANSRANTEEFTIALSDKCEQLGFPNEFFPHHGNLSKELRQDLEARLQQENVPTTAICTMTLELGIDVGKIDTVAQVTPPHTVSSLRQRLGRSGRRKNNPAVLRLYIPEDELQTDSSISNKLRWDTFQTIAMIRLMTYDNWFEPAENNHYHLSTLVQQILSVVGQYGGVKAIQLFNLLCKTGPFKKVNSSKFQDLLRFLGEAQMLTQTIDGQIVLGVKGEKTIEHYSFYSAFSTPVEYRLEYLGKSIGSLPIDFPLFEHQILVFAAKRWQVTMVDHSNKVVVLIPSAGGNAPKFGGNLGNIHDKIRQTMFEIYQSGQIPDYLNKQAKLNANEGLYYFEELNLNNSQLITLGKNIILIPWLGDKICNTLALMLQTVSISAEAWNGFVEISNCNQYQLINGFKSLLEKPIHWSDFSEFIGEACFQKFDHLVPLELRQEAYVTENLDIKGAYTWINDFLESSTFI
jgi:ATP-dependent Lhr-like helicase